MTRILIIDDDKQIRELLCMYFSQHGFDATGADNGRTGIASFQSTGADIIITDIVMPDMEGIETIMAIRRLDSRVPVIAYSGGGRLGPEGYLDVAMKIGASRTFTKPLVLAELLGAVRELLGGTAGGE
jgi:DNA-binding response OmpR family regulator